VLLSVLDRKWREHLYEMDYLRAGIHLRAMANRDPVVEYQREGFDMFKAMLDGIKEESVGFLFHLEVKSQEQQAAEAAQKQAAAEAQALAAAQAGTERVLARQAAAAAAAAPVAPAAPAPAAPVPAAPAPTPAGAAAAAPAAPASSRSGNGGAPVPAPAAAPAGTARRAAKPAAAAPAAPADGAAPVRAGTGPELTVKGLEAPKQPPLTYSAPTLDGSARDSGAGKAAKTATVTGKAPARNAPCPCGSGKKYKFCHGVSGS
jgi:preprotein translocase subunit SecA